LSPKGVSLLLVCLFAAGSTGWGASKHRIPELHGQDIWRAVETPVVDGDEYIYMYGSLLLHPTKKDETEFSLASSRRPYMLPLIILNIYHDIDTYIQSEFLDFTIWGMLGNHFNKNIETIEFENDILRILRKLEGINKKYQSLMMHSKSATQENLVTLNTDRFFTKQEHMHSDGDYKDSYGQSEIERLIRQYNGTQVTFHVQRAEAPEKQSFESSDSVGAPRSMGLSAEPTNENVNNMVFRIVRLFRYLLNHKLEAAIYFWVLIFIVSSTKKIMRGLKA
jgi:hypothetical protein